MRKSGAAAPCAPWCNEWRRIANCQHQEDAHTIRDGSGLEAAAARQVRRARRRAAVPTATHQSLPQPAARPRGRLRVAVSFPAGRRAAGDAGCVCARAGADSHALAVRRSHCHHATMPPCHSCDVIHGRIARACALAPQRPRRACGCSSARSAMRTLTATQTTRTFRRSWLTSRIPGSRLQRRKRRQHRWRRRAWCHRLSKMSRTCAAPRSCAACCRRSPRWWCWTCAPQRRRQQGERVSP